MEGISGKWTMKSPRCQSRKDHGANDNYFSHTVKPSTPPKAEPGFAIFLRENRNPLNSKDKFSRYSAVCGKISMQAPT